MTDAKVEARLADGGEQDWKFGPEFIRKMERLDRAGLTGKALIHGLLTDDWAAPPVVVTVTWTDEDGRKRVRKIEYD